MAASGGGAAGGSADLIAYGQMAAAGGGVGAGSAGIVGYGEMAATGGGAAAGSAALVGYSTPDNIFGASLVEWWDASSGVTNSSGVTHWVGRIHGYDLTPAGNKPSYSATGWNSAFPAVSFASASTQWLSNSVDSALYTAPNGNDTLWSTCAAMKMASNVDATVLSWDGGLAMRSKISNTSGTKTRIQVGTQDSEGVTSIGTNRCTVVWVRRSNTALDLYTNGTKESFTGKTDQGSSTSTQFVCGQIGPSANAQYMNGDITQFALVLGAITDAQAADWRTFCQNYCGGL